MSLRIWLKKGGEEKIAQLRSIGALGNPEIREHEATGKKYIRLGYDPADPAAEIPLIPQEIVERVTFKGKVNLLGNYGVTPGTGETKALPIGSFHSKDMGTHMRISANRSKDAFNSSHEDWCEVSVSSADVCGTLEMLSRLMYNSRLSGGGHTNITEDEMRPRDENEHRGCFKPLIGFPAK